MLQYVLTMLAGLALGIAGMRIWQSREPRPAADALGEDATTAPAPTAGQDAAGQEAAGVAAAGPDSTTLDGSGPGRPAPRRLTPRHALAAAGVLAVAATGVLALGRADEPSPDALAMSASPASGAGKAVADVDTMIERLSARLKANPNDGEGFRMLAWSYAMTGRPDRALEPYQRALQLLPNSALVHSGYGEALVGVAKDVVTPQAKAEFEKAVALDPKEPRAQYFLALWQAQHGEEKQALEKWIVLANSGPADAPWQTDLRRKISEVSGKLGIDVTARLKNPAPAAPSDGAAAAVSAAVPAVAGAMPPPLDAQTIQAANAMPEANRQAMVDQMVSGLAAKLKANPGDVDRWILLLRSRMVLKQADQARADLAAARTALAANPTALARLNAGAVDLGVPGAR